MRAPESVLPRPNAAGDGLIPAEKQFEKERLDPADLRSLHALADEWIDRPDMPATDGDPWLQEWYDQIDEWVNDNGLLLPSPLYKNAKKAHIGFVRNPQLGPHIDARAVMPAAASINLSETTRRLTGVICKDQHEADAIHSRLNLIRGHRISEYPELCHGKQVESVDQEYGDVVHIANYASVHEAKLIEANGLSTSDIVVTIIGHTAVPEYLRVS